jgi:hypothetical protein
MPPGDNPTKNHTVAGGAGQTLPLVILFMVCLCCYPDRSPPPAAIPQPEHVTVAGGRR